MGIDEQYEAWLEGEAAAAQAEAENERNKPKPASTSTVLTDEDRAAMQQQYPCLDFDFPEDGGKTEVDILLESQDAHTRRAIADKLEAIRMQCPGTQLDPLINAFIAQLKEE